MPPWLPAIIRVRVTYKESVLMDKNALANCTHPVPKNRFGIFAMHCRDNQPIGEAAMKKIIEGPIAAMQPKLDAELAKPGESIS
jgi:hypothetical protein